MAPELSTWKHSFSEKRWIHEAEQEKKKKKKNKDWATDWATDWALRKQSQFTAPQHPP